MKSKNQTFDIQSYLSAMPLFSNLTDEERARLAQGCLLKRLTRGDMVFRTGDLCEAFYVVILGQVKLYVATPNGQEKVVEIVGPGRSFAEAMMFLDIPYILNVQALTDTLLMCVSKKAVFSEIDQDPKFARKMLAGISRRLHGLVQDVEAYALHSGIQRLIGFLLREVNQDDADNVTVSLPVSKATIASRLSLTPEYFSRVLHELEAEGLIAIDKRDVRILDVQRLAHYGAQ
ncbi:Crp/Fnr family transcriptional regulator [Rhodoferax sp.]|uniref:Crp/Fnr family transcriptional regulator n=1 Tax=Rhodoferax sp. TaxID=50421 RepID=UPI00262CBCCA|nr:Crp/Fnr family transcriptional regulator [Rhodoferax sp.]MDD2808288.1 Crp/Fnr family transcriptional regulator [Rhodoferax sp.]